MDETKWQVGKTSSTHYSIAYHLVWLAKHRRRALTGEYKKKPRGS
jgi:REP element-mobilizing transposase RayT